MGKALGISNVTIGAGDGAGLPSPPLGVTGLAGSYRYSDPKNDGTPDAHGTRTLELLIKTTAPSPLGTFLGGHLWYEYPDQSLTDDFILDGASSPLNGTINLNGPWTPTDAGKFPFKADGTAWVIKGLKVPSTSVNIRVYCVPYSKNEDNHPTRATLPSPSPSVVIDVAPPLTTASGEEYTQNVTNFVAVASAAMEGGVSVTHIKCTFDAPIVGTIRSDRRWGGVQIVIRHPNGEDQLLGIFTASGTDSKFQTPNIGENVTVFAVSFSQKSPEGTGGSLRGVNSLIPGVTPSMVVTIGTLGGTLDLGQSISSSLGSALAIIGLVINVKSQGITQALVADFAIADQQLAIAAVLTGNIASGAVTTPKVAAANITSALIGNAAITNALIANAAIGTTKIQNAAITTALIAALAVTDAQIGSLDAGKINTGTLTAITIVLNLNGVTTTISNTIVGGRTVGVRVQDNGSSIEMQMTKSQLIGFNSSSLGTVFVNADDGTGSGSVNVGNGSQTRGTLSVSGSGAFGQLALDGTGARILIDSVQVLGAQQTGPGTPSFGSLANAQTWCAALLTALQAHGLVT